MSTATTAPNKVREYEYTASDFEQVRQLIRQHAGIALSTSKQDMVYSRLARRLRERRMTRFADYLRMLEGGDLAEREAFINSLTTNLTSFYREAHHFPILAEHLRARWARTREPIKVWCCAASTGEEPYTIAMTAMEAFDTDTPPVQILATDVDTSVLEKARAGVYDVERIADIDPERTQRFFLKGTGARAGFVKVAPALQKLITFRHINLLDERWPMRGLFDAVMCRNVMIYFEKETQRRIIEGVVPVMQPDGLFFAGHSENFVHCADLLKLRGKTVYEVSGARAGRRS